MALFGGLVGQKRIGCYSLRWDPVSEKRRIRLLTDSLFLETSFALLARQLDARAPIGRAGARWEG